MTAKGRTKKKRRGMNESNIEGSPPELRWVGHEDCYVWIYEQHDEDTKKDGRSKEPFKNLEGVSISKNASKNRSEHTQVIAHAAMTKFASTKG